MQPASVVFTTFSRRTPPFFYSLPQGLHDLLDGGRSGRDSMFVDEVPERQNRMPVYHPRTGKPHHPSDLLLHLGLVAMYRALAACWLLIPERAFLRPLFGIDRERPALFTESLSASVMAAAIDADHLPYRLYLPLRSPHAFGSASPLQQE